MYRSCFTLCSVALSAAFIVGCGGGSNDAEDAGPDARPPDVFNAEIVRTEYGIPHVTAEDWGGLGYGYGYAYAQDNYCVLMKEIVRSNGQAARYFGGESNLREDFVYRFYNTEDYIQNQFIAAVSEDLQALVRGYAAGLNRYLEETGLGGLAEGDEGCRNAEWVREVTEVDLAKVYRKLILRASTGPLAPAMIVVEAPNESVAALADSAPRSFAVAADALGLPKPEQMGSNAYAIGSDASQTGYGIVLGNPHFPWQGPERFYVAHLTIPGVYNVMGASLQGVPIVNIGFNENVAWSHTVSTARRFGFYEVKLSATDPMKYIYDGEERDIVANPVSAEIKLEDGTIETRQETIYTTHFGPIVNLGSINALLDGWPTFAGTLIAARDANLFNDRALIQWQAIGQSENLGDLQDALEILGIPWVNTIAADREGLALYADVGSMPHITQDKLDLCATTTLAAVLTGQGFPSLDGSRSECEWGSDPDTPDGLLGPANLPKLVTREYVANSNDSYWLSNPDHLLEGFSPVIGAERIEQSLRTRQAFVQAEQRVAGTDGLGEPGFTVEHVQELMWGSRNIAAELTLEDVVTLCESINDWSTYTVNVKEADEACSLLGDWDGRFAVDRVGPHIFHEFWRRARNIENLWTVPFDADDPVHTPNELNTGDKGVADAILNAFGDAVDALVNANLPMNRTWGELQFRQVGDTRIPIHGGNSMFMFSVITSNLVADEGYSNITHGNSYMQTVTWDETACPDAYAMLSYSQSTDPASDHFSDLTMLYSTRTWVDMPFCEADIEAQEISSTSISTED